MTKFFKVFLLPYIIILVITLISFAIFYTRSAVIIEDKIIEGQLAYLRQIRTNLDNSVTGIVHTANQAASNPQIRSFLHINEPYIGSNVIRLIEATNVLSEYNIDNPFLISIVAVFDHNGLVISPILASRLAYFYPYYMHIEGQERHEWISQIFSNNYHSRFVPTMNAGIGHGSYEVIQHITPIRASYGNIGAIISFIDSRAVQNLFRSPISDEGVKNLIISSSGDVISLMADISDISHLPWTEAEEGSVKFEHNGYNYLMIYTSSNILDWTYISVIRSDSVLVELNTFRQTFVLIILIMFSISLVFSIIFSVRQSGPVKKLQETISRQMPLLQHSFMKNLLDGKLYKNDDIANNITSLGFDLSGTQYITAVISDTDNTMDLVKLAKIRMLIENLESLHSNKPFRHQSLSIGGNELVVLFIGEDDDLEGYAHSFLFALENSLHTNNVNCVSIGVGNLCINLIDVHKSYLEAVRAIQYYAVVKPSCIICQFQTIPHNNELYFYSDEEERRLLNLVRNGDTEGVRTVLNSICGENITNRQLSPNMMTAFINHLCQGIFKIDRIGTVNNEDVEKINELHSMFYNLTDLEKLTRCSQLYIAISESICNQKHSKTHSIISEIKTICEENFQDPDINLASLALRFNLNEAYLSTQYKEHTGENFYTYFQNLRINKAIQLLSTSKLTIHEISERVGYSSYNTFSKAFKRKTGVNAGDYRKLLKT